MEEMASLLYGSLFDKLMKLDDGVIIYPGHGPGSVCGTAIAGRMWTTIGIERAHNPRLQYTDRAEFIANATRELERPPYFRQVEKLNVEGAPILGSMPVPKPMSPNEFVERARDAIVVDTRMEMGFGASHVPGAISIWLGGIPSFAGWFLPYDRPILLVNDTDNPEQAARSLIRMGYDGIDGYLSGEMHAWHTAGLESESTKTVTVHELCHLLDGRKGIWILDVRSEEEVAKTQIPGAHNIHITQLPDRMDEVPRDRSVYVFCGSGLRSMIGASLLQRQGWHDLTVVLGGLAGWSSISCPITFGK
jgi:hydroxyacylglutathione hydrolase